MSQKESQFNAISSILNSLDNILSYMLSEHTTEIRLARSFAKKIDNLIYQKQQEERQEKKTIDKTKTQENTEVQNLKNRIVELMDKMTELKEKVQSGKPEDIDFDILDTDRPIDTLAIVDGLLSSPSGDDSQFLGTSFQYLQQKTTERVKELTIDFIQEVRNTFLIRVAQHSKIHYNQFRDIMESVTLMTANVGISVKKFINSKDQNPENQEDKPDNGEKKLPKYQI